MVKLLTILPRMIICSLSNSLSYLAICERGKREEGGGEIPWKSFQLFEILRDALGSIACCFDILLEILRDLSHSCSHAILYGFSEIR